ncbi:ABC transporter substrate-binding protein [Methylobacterium brachiatum]|uniref:ABC transporter substrate-binding protein n=1 Tax=Methylobacterium brachiatum TaxID=269660 RepID=UPI0008E84847|nr:ABC transporter substrate-binding protein [Methylobacterium brachiatum]SFJ47309.1 amino acid/amide ABC transporter substrate-binding protein, HAAT family [Methylobacterium brachiatum]
MAMDRSVTSRALALLAAAGLLAAGEARAADPIRIGVIAEAQSVVGASIPQAVQLAADEINAKGGIDGRQIQVVSYDDKSSASDAVRAFQRAVSEDKVHLVIASYISEVVLALMPWSARLKTPMITPGAASNEISLAVHKDYARNKYTFHGYLTSAALAQSICDSTKDMLLDLMKVKTAAIMSEDAAWTRPLDAGYEKCLPEIGVKVVDHIRFSPDTGDFTPIYKKIEAGKPDLIVTGISHVGVQPTVQWRNQQVPLAMTGMNSQATSSTFWANTNGATQGVIFQSIAVPGAAITDKSLAFSEAFKKRFGSDPSYAGYMAYDQVYYTADAVKRAGSTEADKLVDALEKTDWVGTVGRTQFYGKDEPFTHSIKYGPGFVTGLMAQWQDGKQVAIWPTSLAQGKIVLPPSVKAAAR